MTGCDQELNQARRKDLSCGRAHCRPVTRCDPATFAHFKHPLNSMVRWSASYPAMKRIFRFVELTRIFHPPAKLEDGVLLQGAVAGVRVRQDQAGDLVNSAHRGHKMVDGWGFGLGLKQLTLMHFGVFC
ncbi:hypothetical protein K493DRAFT_72165 [Basidiobolus meristosporus CBS 931.73]|uniref:Uncharacterized protein n=1 Tax=Basidiobolus meristosporus CBS 931.73 TaxID=1314790 RepID=A0A1Y1YYZ0_9FUNG|nr:hypothetical protein K493DRAFT_72165 [Basidiobolus meristosporus CBS 931.73]|eukprot:ORY03268.1 hypothetical protein K493DRAFT_72165 [Basidiobolus meristosporus CBS 931.73]